MDDNWEQAKLKVDGLSFSDDMPMSHSYATSHGEKHDHEIFGYVVPFPMIHGFEVIGEYSYCKDCMQARNKKIVIFNEGTRSCYVRSITRKGKSVML